MGQKRDSSAIRKRWVVGAGRGKKWENGKGGFKMGVESY